MYREIGALVHRNGELMRIAILGWGSLLWEGIAEFDRWHDAWKYDGPSLKIAFSRISESRLGALTLVMDAQHGGLIGVAWCLSKRTNLEDALCDLRCREGTTVGNIGWMVVAPHSDSTKGDAVEYLILTWARAKKVDAIVWTALKSNFKDITKQPFSIDAAMLYLRGLRPEGKVEAAEYVRRAPDFVKTPLRSALQRQPWFSERGRQS